MYNVIIRFYEELNDFIAKNMRRCDYAFSFSGRRSIKDLIESFGAPHVEVDLILVNGESVDFSYIVNDGDRISVYPVFERLSIEGVTRLRPFPLRDPRFILDVHLRSLARRLRLLGFDVDYKDKRDDCELVEVSENTGRIILTRDRQLLKLRNVSRGMIIRNTDMYKQVVEVIERLDLKSQCMPFSRCIECNGMIRGISSEDDEFLRIRNRIPEGVLCWCQGYSICASCDKIYWKGSHYDKLKAFVERIIDDK